MVKLLLTGSLLFLFSGCIPQFQLTQSQSKKETLKKETVKKSVRNSDFTKPYAKINNIHQNLNGAIVAMADQLFTSNTHTKKQTKLILTSFVDLNQLNKTTTFGRILGESMFNELHIRKFKIIDFRGQDAISVNADGEFHITRDTSKLKDTIESAEYIVVGTYTKFEGKSILINARILDSISGMVISTARIIYKPVDCTLFDICKTKKIKTQRIQKVAKKINPLTIIQDSNNEY